MLWRITWQAIIIVITCGLLLADCRIYKNYIDKLARFFRLRPVAYIKINIVHKIKMDPKKKGMTQEDHTLSRRSEKRLRTISE